MARTPQHIFFRKYRKQTLVRICVINAGYEYPDLAGLACLTSRTKPRNKNKKELVRSYFDRLRVWRVHSSHRYNTTAWKWGTIPTQLWGHTLSERQSHTIQSCEKLDGVINQSLTSYILPVFAIYSKCIAITSLFVIALVLFWRSAAFHLFYRVIVILRSKSSVGSPSGIGSAFLR